MLPHNAEQIMTRDVVTIHKGSSIEEALRLMSARHISGLPVVDVDGQLVGMLTESDVLLRGQAEIARHAAPLPGLGAREHDRVSEAYRKARAVTVEDAMTKDVIAFGEHSSVADIARVMIERDINRVPVVRGRQVVGIISRRDVIRSMAALEFDPQSAEYDAPEAPRIAL
jgi:CBS domain-containing protein